jgi:hypothetical protein
MFRWNRNKENVLRMYGRARARARVRAASRTETYNAPNAESEISASGRWTIEILGSLSRKLPSRILGGVECCQLGPAAKPLDGGN